LFITDLSTGKPETYLLCVHKSFNIQSSVAQNIIPVIQ